MLPHTLIIIFFKNCLQHYMILFLTITLHDVQSNTSVLFGDHRTDQILLQSCLLFTELLLLC